MLTSYISLTHTHILIVSSCYLVTFSMYRCIGCKYDKVSRSFFWVHYMGAICHFDSIIHVWTRFFDGASQFLFLDDSQEIIDNVFSNKLMNPSYLPEWNHRDMMQTKCSIPTQWIWSHEWLWIVQVRNRIIYWSLPQLGGWYSQCILRGQ